MRVDAVDWVGHVNITSEPTGSNNLYVSDKKGPVDGILWLPTPVYWSCVTHKKAARTGCYGVTDCMIHAGFKAEPSKLCIERIWAELVSYSVLEIKIDWILKLTTNYMSNKTQQRAWLQLCTPWHGILVSGSILWVSTGQAKWRPAGNCDKSGVLSADGWY